MEETNEKLRAIVADQEDLDNDTTSASVLRSLELRGHIMWNKYCALHLEKMDDENRSRQDKISAAVSLCFAGINRIIRIVSARGGTSVKVNIDVDDSGWVSSLCSVRINTWGDDRHLVDMIIDLVPGNYGGDEFGKEELQELLKDMALLFESHYDNRGYAVGFSGNVMKIDWGAVPGYEKLLMESTDISEADAFDRGVPAADIMV